MGLQITASDHVIFSPSHARPRALTDAHKTISSRAEGLERQKAKPRQGTYLTNRQTVVKSEKRLHRGDTFKPSLLPRRYSHGYTNDKRGMYLITYSISHAPARYLRNARPHQRTIDACMDVCKHAAPAWPTHTLHVCPARAPWCWLRDG